MPLIRVDLSVFYRRDNKKIERKKKVENKETKKLLTSDSLQKIDHSRVEVSTEESISKSKGISKRKETRTGEQLAELLLYKSCSQVFKRIKDKKKKAYNDVKCSWDKPLAMKQALMRNNEFWDAWKKQSSIYESNCKELKFRPTIDRIESDPCKGGHYTANNIRVLSYLENSTNANMKECVVFFFKNAKIEKFVRFPSIKEALITLDVSYKYFLHSVINTGKFYDMGNGYTVILQTVSGQLKAKENKVQNAEVTNKTYIVDFETGNEYLIKVERLSFQSPSIWWNR